VLVNVMVSEELAIALAQRAEAEDITQKQVITPASVAAGPPVDRLDLEERNRGATRRLLLGDRRSESA